MIDAMRPTLLPLAAAVLAAVVGPAAQAQAPVRDRLEGWQLPLRGCAQYERRAQPLVVAPPEVERDAALRHVVRAADQGGHLWRYRVFDAGLGADGWQDADYDDAGWQSGRTPFGDRWQRTAWPANQRYLDVRAEFQMPRRGPKAAVLLIGHDDLCDVYLNGVEIYRGDRFLLDQWVALDEGALEAFVAGRNVLAVRVENTGGASHFDLGLTVCERSFRDPVQAVNLVKSRIDGARRLRDGLFPAFRSPPLLCEGQLDASHERIALPPIDLRDLAAFVAFDLGRGILAHPVDGELPRTWRFGDVQFKGRATEADADGNQRIEVDLRSRMPDRRDDEPRFVEGYVQPQYTHELDAHLVIDRRLDVQLGVVTSFRSELTGEFAPREGELTGTSFQLGQHEDWTLTDVRPNRDTWFNEAVLDAIHRGADKLKAEIRDPDGRELRNEPTGDRTYNTGRLALALLALLHAEVPPDDPVVARGLDELRRRRLYDTYATAHAIMAIERLYAPRGEYESLHAGTIDRPYKRAPSEADRALLQEWTNILLNNVDTRVDAGYLLRFNYTRGGRYDHSVNQYGLLGLYSAHLCGIAIPSTVWEGAANHLIDDQQKPTGRRKLTLSTYRQWEEERRGGTTTAGERTTRIAGWGYQGPKSNGIDLPVYGSMTCAGIAGLTICLAGLRDCDVTRAKLTSSAEESIRMGFAWLAEHFTVHSNALRYQQPYFWVYYYLYGLERACELSGVALLDGRDWYYEGALTLIAQQHPDGGWPDDMYPDQMVVRTAMAVLFLKKASMPVYTQR
ncbi:MAG: hypothetical protein IPM29_15595 [Planctomycetes bacterium]|nr:hypothetical protein [Planctomycetota bacterium]